MGTRADFYIKSGEKLEANDWIGSIAWDGYPKGLPAEIKKAKTRAEFELAVKELATREDFTSKEEGWPWPWETSEVTDYAYVFDGDKVRTCNWGKGYNFPKMQVGRIQMGKKSGLIAIEG